MLIFLYKNYFEYVFVIMEMNELVFNLGVLEVFVNNYIYELEVFILIYILENYEEILKIVKKVKMLVVND